MVALTALLATSASAAALQPTSAVTAKTGQQDFAWEIGTWKTELKRLKAPLTGSTDWVAYSGTSVVRALLDGRANVVELRVAGPAGRIEGTSLRLFNPQAQQWSLNFASARDGTLTRPVHGGFHDGRGEFFGEEDVDGKIVLVRFVISEASANSAHFEQAYSGDGGKTWEINWIADDTRIGD
jgi:hypothetical protein